MNIKCGCNHDCDCSLFSEMIAKRIGVNPVDLDNEVIETIITIGKGCYWSEELHREAKSLEEKINGEFEMINNLSG